jgi:hypothetical protein
MRYRPLQLACACLVGITALALSLPAAAQADPTSAGLFAGGGLIALSIIIAAVFLKLADLWIFNLKTLGDIKSDLAFLREMRDGKVDFETRGK